jgi:hypothetical protein
MESDLASKIFGVHVYILNHNPPFPIQRLTTFFKTDPLAAPPLMDHVIL